MGLSERRAIYAQIERHRNRPLVAYVTSKRRGVHAHMATDVLPFLIEQLDALGDRGEKKELDFLIASLGGDPMVAWRIMSLIRERMLKVSVLIPTSAFSAATLLALGGDDIYVHTNGHLGPIDMQIDIPTEGGRRNFSTEDIAAFVDFVRKDLAITDQEHLRHLFEVTCREVGSIGVGFNARSQKLAVALAERLLEMSQGGKAAESVTNRTIVESLSTQFHSHSYPVSRAEALKMQLPVNKEADATLESLMWQLWLDMEEELKEREPFDPVYEALRSPNGAPLLADVPQLDLAGNAFGPSNFTADLTEVSKASVYVKPIDFAVVDAIIESERLSYWSTSKGKILASRMPDLNIQYNALVTYRGWEKKHP